MNEPAVSETAIREQAAEWIVRLGGALDENERQSVEAACRDWCAASERHARIFEQMQRMWQAAAEPAELAESSQPAQARAKTRRRKTAAAFLAVFALAWLLPLQHWLADVRVAPGELRRVELDDGSRLTLDSGASIDIRYDAKTREIKLHAGRLLAEVAKDAQGRAFRVVSRDGSAEALGTRYVVDQRQGDTAVSVLESAVAVASRANPQAPVVLAAGQTARYTRAAVEALRELPDGAASEAWAYGHLIFNQTPLPEVVAELARHRRGLLILRDAEALADLRFTGMLPLNDSDAALRILARSLPVEIGRATPYLVWLEAKTHVGPGS
jgi:transmembrane sensor